MTATTTATAHLPTGTPPALREARIPQDGLYEGHRVLERL